MGRFLRTVLAAIAANGVLATALAAGCTGARSVLPPDIPDAGDAAVEAAPEAGPPPITTSHRVDLLLVVDDAPDGDAFQALFAATEGYLLGRFAQPACVNGLGSVVATTALPTDPCPDGQREFSPLNDVHVGVITTSLGGHGADSCSPASPTWNPTQDDAAHLITRGPGGAVVPTYQSLGFLDWDPDQTATPPGEADLTALTTNLTDLTTGAGTEGCPFPSHLESIYRFLVDPDPSLTVSIVNGQAVLDGTDVDLLQQRADFLRPDSALVIVLLTGQDDCSTLAGGQSYLSEQAIVDGQPFHLPPPRSACAVDPNDPCCASCGAPTPAGCDADDPACENSTLADLADPLSLRCFDQKRRFGVDFLYPVQRYVDGLTQPEVPTRDGTMVPNPLYTADRSPELVMMAGIVGVPWQDISGAPHSLAGGYAPAGQIDWTLLLGDPAKSLPPADPLMIPSIAPRTGTDPATGDPLEPPDSPPLANPSNGHERTVPDEDGLQYACIYARPTPVPCTASPCPCVDPNIQTNPLCQASDGSYGPTALYAGALPSTRDLTVLQGLGDRASVASICAQITTDPNDIVYAYRPAVDGILRTLRPRVQ